MSFPLSSSPTVPGGGPTSSSATVPPRLSLLLRPQFPSARTASHIARAANKSTPKPGKFDLKKRKNILEQEKGPGRRTTMERESEIGEEDGAVGVIEYVDDGFVMPDVYGKIPEFWEGSKWDGLGFFVQYMWAFGIGFAVVACGIAVATYNEGATDFKETPVYKDSVQSREFLEESESSNSDVFESNPTEEAPSLE